jgi:glycosyltransferase involved in cell wall biosynthesis
MKSQKKISIIVPIYNVQEYLEKCLTSIILQTYNNLEIILVNDGSKDDCDKIISSFSERDYRFKLINQKNEGLSSARNTGLDVASGDFIMFIDSDDWVDSNYVSTLLSKMDEGFDMVMVPYFRAYQNHLEPRYFGWQGEYSALEIKRRLLGLYKEELKDPSQADSMVTVWGKLYNAKVIKQNKLKFVDTNIIGSAEDLLINLQYIQHVEKVFIIDNPMYFYRKDNLVSFTKNYRPKLLKQWEVKYKLIAETVSITTDDEKNAFQNRIALGIIGLCLNEMGNTNGRKVVFQNMRKIFEEEKYNVALKQLETKYFPLHWKFFFWASKQSHVFIVYYLTKGIVWILNRKNLSNT